MSIVHKSYDYGQFLVTYRYLSREDGPGQEGHMVLTREGKPWCVIPARDAWRFADSKTGGPTPWLLVCAIDMAETLGLLATQGTVHKIASAIVDGLPDLIAMPPWEYYERQLPKAEPIGTVTATLDGHTFEAALSPDAFAESVAGKGRVELP